MFLESKDRFEFFFNDDILEDFHFMNVGYEKCLPKHGFGPQVREYYVIHYIIDGKGTFSFKNNNYHLGVGDFFLIKPEDSDPFYQADNVMPWSYMWFGFEGSKTEEILSQYGFYNDNRVGHCSKSEILATELKYLLKKSFFANSSFLMIQGKLLSVLSHLTLDGSNISLHSNKNSAEQLIDSFIFYIRQNYWKMDLSVQKISDDLGITPSYLTRTTTKYLNQNAGTYLTNYRMLKARFLVENTDHSIEAIARSIGYQNPLSFSRAFKRVYGCSPRNLNK